MAMSKSEFAAVLKQVRDESAALSPRFTDEDNDAYWMEMAADAALSVLDSRYTPNRATQRWMSELMTFGWSADRLEEMTLPKWMRGES